MANSIDEGRDGRPLNDESRAAALLSQLSAVKSELPYDEFFPAAVDLYQVNGRFLQHVPRRPPIPSVIDVLRNVGQFLCPGENWEEAYAQGRVSLFELLCGIKITGDHSTNLHGYLVEARDRLEAHIYHLGQPRVSWEIAQCIAPLDEESRLDALN